MNLKQLLGICEHKWKIIKEVKVFGRYSDRVRSDLPESFEHILQCEKCGIVKKKKL
jgi:uncharacterized protein (DUF3820 family)